MLSYASTIFLDVSASCRAINISKQKLVGYATRERIQNQFLYNYNANAVNSTSLRISNTNERKLYLPYSTEPFKYIAAML